MALTKRRNNWYGEDHADLRKELARYSTVNGYPIDNFTNVKCKCGCQLFELYTDEEQGAAMRTCTQCHNEHLMGDSADYVSEAELVPHECNCRKDQFQIVVGVHRYRNADDSVSDDVRWLYIGCRCPKCNLLGCYADWKNEFEEYRKLLRRM
ncbi:hypothetical protein LOC67_08280 [Stieleria sp. JC731]|uniref:hypothetical protein n=1 Tax=Pirellulaceae TaxID=2691357 RepID=UPI001E57B653|nr:hypothetical protein [Stieleria sp. JC731]MCC9600555.1 hypothetical protein [Stieleria sp. JC731]